MKPPHEVSVLVVDDESRMRELLHDVICDMAFASATLTKSAEEALRELAVRRHDIAILDMQLPAMDGMDLFAEIRQRWPEMQVIVLTGFGNFDAARAAIRLDVVDFLSKPCHVSEIELALDRARRRLQFVDHSESGNAAQPECIVEGQQATLAELERREILCAIERAGGNRSLAARRLGISRRTLHHRLFQYNVARSHE